VPSEKVLLNLVSVNSFADANPTVIWRAVLGAKCIASHADTAHTVTAHRTLRARKTTMFVTHKAAAKRTDQFLLSEAATYVRFARIYYDERREGSMPLLFERLLEKIYNTMIIKNKLVPGRGLKPRR
jgi:hypothetical protein